MLTVAAQNVRLEKAKTDVQRNRMRAIHAAGKDAWAETITGKGVVDSFFRYCETRDPAKITNGLYHFSMYTLDSIAHFDINGFRAEYPHPIVWIVDLLEPWLARGFAFRDGPEDYHTLHVYKDGMTDGDVLYEIKAIVERNRQALARDAQNRIRRRDEQQLQELAARLGFRIVPIDDAD